MEFGMRLNSDSGPIFIFVCIVVGILFYGKVHEFSVWINLDMDSTW
jgi:hypothetical protein